MTIQQVITFLMTQSIHSLRIDLENHIISWKGERVEDAWQVDQFDGYSLVEELYNNYYNSVASKNDNCPLVSKNNEECSYQEQLEVGKHSMLGKIISTVIVLGARSGSFPWTKGFYWQSKKYPSLILFKDWCC